MGVEEKFMSLRKFIYREIERRSFRSKQFAIVISDYFIAAIFLQLSSFGQVAALTTFAALAIPLLLIGIFALARVYSYIPSFFGLFEARKILVLILSFLLAVTIAFKIELSLMWVLYCLLFIVMLLTIRFGVANWRQLLLGKFRKRDKAFIFGAGTAGIQLLRSLRLSGTTEIIPVGFIDDHPSKLGLTLDGLPVRGGRREIGVLASRFGVKTVVLAIPSATDAEKLEVVEICRSAGLIVKTTPELGQVINFQVNRDYIRDLDPQEFLGRAQVNHDPTGLETLVRGQTVLITGAGGSIGGELSVQIAQLSPARLIVVELSEFALYELDRRLKNILNDSTYELILCDVRDYCDTEKVFQKYHPSMVLHAAAYKHVPLVELNPQQAVRTNILGSRNIAELAVRYKVRKLVLVSTDKAVNPTNVMGATKRIAELVCQAVTSGQTLTKFCGVRFGNVLGSSGSVVPLFKRQIESGGPVTVTDRNITRYFMSISEASQLVLQAAMLSEGGEIFVLDMGTPVRILDLAENMIRAVGLKPYDDIDIVFTGLRPGEKLYEELLADSETTLPTTNKKIHTALLKKPDPRVLEEIQNLIESRHLDDNALIVKIKNIVPEFNHRSIPRSTP